MTDTAEDDVVLVDVEGRIAVVTLNRPARRNALNRALLTRLRQVVPALDADEDVDAVVLTGADPAFCAGIDLVEAGQASGVLTDPMPVEFRGMLPPCSKPIIGAVNGPAITGGFEVALSCDFLVASERARFADTHSRVGVMPGGGLSVKLARAVGMARAKQLSVTGRFLDAETAFAWGLVNHVVRHEELLAFCRGLAEDIVSNDQRAVRFLLQTYHEQEAADEEAAWTIEERQSSTWRGAGYDPEEIARRRALVIGRGRQQIGEP